MKVYEVVKGSTGLDGLVRAERPEPKPGPHEVLIRIRATSLNYRDQMVVTGKYFTAVERNTIPLSDGAGEVVAVGPAATGSKPEIASPGRSFRFGETARGRRCSRRSAFRSMARWRNTSRCMRTA